MGLSRRERREQRNKLLKEQRLNQLKTLEEQEKKIERKGKYNIFLRFYDKHYMRLLIIPVIILILALGSIAFQIINTGDFINKGVSLKGGVVITVPVHAPIPIKEIEDLLKSQFPKDDIEVRSAEEFGVQKAIIITTDNINAEKDILAALTSKIPDAKEEASSETTGSSLGGGFFQQTMLAMIIAFVFMGIVVFISFRTFAPSMAVIICAFADIVETVAVTNLLGMKVSTGGIAAFLMLIGYSVDTDILLTTRVLRGKEGSVFDRVLSSAKTGILMTLTTIIAVTIGLFLTQSGTIKEIMIIMLIGLIADLLNTWIQNVALLRYYVEHIQHKKHAAPKPAEAEVVAEEKGEDEEEGEEQEEPVVIEEEKEEDKEEDKGEEDK